MIVALVVGGTIGIVLTNTSANSLKQDVLRNNLNQADLAAQFASIYIKAVQNHIEVFADRPDIRQAVLDGSFTQIQPILALFVQTQTVLDTVGLYDTQGIQITNSTSSATSIGQSFADSDWYIQTRLTLQPYLDTPTQSRTTGSPIVPFVVPILDEQGQLRGILEGDISLTALSVAMVNTNYGTDVQATIIDTRNGIILAHIDPQRVLNPVSGENEAVTRLMTGERGTIQTQSSSGEIDLIGYAPVPDLPWGTLVITPLSAALAPINSLRLQSLIIILISILAVGLIGGLWMVRVTRPLLRLRDAAHKIATGDLAYRVKITQQNEIGELGNEFNQMAEDLTVKDQQLRNYAVHLEDTNKALENSKASFINIVEKSTEGIIIADVNGTVRFSNAAARGFLFHGEGTTEGRRVLFTLSAGETINTDIFLKDGAKGTGEVSVTDTEWELKKSFLVTIRDISERKQAEEKIKQDQAELSLINNKLEERNRENSIMSEMRELLQLCSTVQEVAPIVTNSVAKVFPGTDGALFLLNNSRTDLQSVARWGNFPQDAEDNIFAPDACWGLRLGRIHVVEDIKIGPICPHLKHPPTSAYICLPLAAKGETLGLLHLRTKLSVPGEDNRNIISELKEIAIIFAEYLSLSIANIKLWEKLTDQSIRDPLTGLYNRRYMEETIQREILRAARKQSKIGIIMADIDHFKKFNDTYGHKAGDELLVKLAELLKSKIRGSDIACRYGGEEFILILPESSADDTYKRAESIREEVKNMKVYYRDQHLPSITISLGITTYPDHGTEFNELIRLADMALYKAKEQGRDRVISG